MRVYPQDVHPMLPLQTDTLQNRYGKRAMSLFVSKDEESLTYDGFRQLLERRAKRARLSNKPELHGFRRVFALNMLRSGVDIFVLQRLVGHSDLQVLRRYLAQNDEDSQLAHMRGSPVDNNF